MELDQLSLDGATPSVSTDLLDYLPGSTATITASGSIVGSTIEFQVSHVLDAGAGAGTDTLMLSGKVGGTGVVIVDLSSATDQVVSIGGVADALTQKNFERIDATGLGSSVNATGRSDADIMAGSDGNDTLSGGDGHDVLNGGATRAATGNWPLRAIGIAKATASMRCSPADL